MFNKVEKSIQFGAHELKIETGEIGRQADSTVLVSYGDTVVLVAVTSRKEVKEGQDFFPLTVDYQEKTYAAGKIPGGFFKREGRPSEKETLTSRLIDRPLRPLFPEGFYNEVQVVATVMSSDPEIDSDIPAIIGASAAMSFSGIPFYGPLGAVRVGYVDGEYVTNPSKSQMEETKLDLVLGATEDAVMMVESEAKELSEEVMLGAVTFGHEQIQAVIQLINDMAEEVGNEPWEWTAPEPDTALTEKVAALVGDDVAAAFKIQAKGERSTKLAEIKDRLMAELTTEETTTEEANKVKDEFFKLEASVVRSQILNGEPRIDGRDTRTVRPISVRTGILPRTHGSALFTRGETQALVVATLGTSRDEQVIDALQGEYTDRFMLHYNFPPYSTGETGRVGTPKRREIGHGRLAKRALVAALPEKEDFDYTMRVVSEITESNGSSSMASVCGGTLALMDAGVPMKAPVAGIAMGLIKEGNRVAVLTDILGDEDHLGDMDFKVAGTVNGITALQMDIKIAGITAQIMQAALSQAKEGREHILGIMQEALSNANTEMSEFAPRIISLKINPDKIRDVIGKGGATIQALTKETNTSIDIEEDGTVKIACTNADEGAEAKRRIEELTAEVEVGQVYEGAVVKVLDFGAVVSLIPGQDGLVHISQIAHERVNAVSDYVKEGDTVKVKVVEIDGKGKVRLSMKALIEKPTLTDDQASALDAD